MIELQGKHIYKTIGKATMIIGLLGILYNLIEPLFVISGCFGRHWSEIIIQILPIALLILGYRVYSENE